MGCKETQDQEIKGEIVEGDSGPRCKLLWEDGQPVIACETERDRDVAAKALREHDVLVRVRVREEA